MNELEISTQTIHAESLYYHIASKALKAAKIAETSTEIRENVVITVTFQLFALKPLSTKYTTHVNRPKTLIHLK